MLEEFQGGGEGPPCVVPRAGRLSDGCRNSQREIFPVNNFETLPRKEIKKKKTFCDNYASAVKLIIMIRHNNTVTIIGGS